MATPPTVSAEASPISPSSRSMSVISTSSLARWRLAQGTTDAQASTSQTIADNHGKAKAESEKRVRRHPQVAFADATNREVPSTHNSPPHECVSGASLSGSHSIEERSYRHTVSDSAWRSLSDSKAEVEKAAVTAPRTGHSELHAVAGDEPARRSFSSGSPQNGDLHLKDQRSADSPTAIAVSVPGIAQDRNAAAEAYADRWTAEVKRSTAPEEELTRAYRQLETKLHEAENRLATAEARQQREMSALTTQLQSEKNARLKAERDREELLNQASVSPSLSPRVHALSRGNVLHVSAEGGDHPRCSGSGGGPTAAVNGVEVGGGANTVATYVSEAFYEKMKEREERARARVRKEFVRQTQENVYAEQKKTAEAEKAAALATRKLQQTEVELRTTQDALQEANSVMEAKDVQLHERAIHIQELEARLRLLQRQLESAEEAKAQADQQGQRKLEDLQKLADLRLNELEAQRHFAQQLQVQLGLKTRDLFDQESNQEGVLQQVLALQARCKALEGDLEAGVREATSLLDQRRQQAEADAHALREQNEKLKRRCAAAEAEMGSVKSARESDATELALLRERYEKDLNNQKVEVRSLQLQLEQVLDAANHSSAQSATAADIDRQQHAALLRKYAAEATAAREEHDRTRAMMQRANEKHMRTTLELSQQMTSLKQENTRLEHKVNIYKHESADATRLLARAREELSQLREERRRLSVSLVDFRDDSRMRSVEGQDALQRRVAELENVRRDLNDKLLEANRIIEDLRPPSQYAVEQSSRYLPIDGRGSSAPDIFRIEAPSPRHSHRRQRGTHVDAFGSGRNSTNGNPRPSSRASVASATDSLGLPELLESMAAQLEPIVHSLPHRSPEEDEEGESTFSSSALPLTQRERLPPQWQSMPLEERKPLDQVLTSCTAALRCNAKSQHVLGSLSKQCVVEKVAEGRPCRGKSTDDEASAPNMHASRSTHRASALPTQWQSSAAALHAPQGQQYTRMPQTDSPPPQELLARPRRSMQQSVSSVVADDVMMRFSHTSEVTPTRLPKRCTVATEPLVMHASHAEERDHKNAAIRGSTDASLSKYPKAIDDANAAEQDDRVELESEQFWDCDELESGRTPHAAENESPSAHHLPRERVQALPQQEAPLEPNDKTTQSSQTPSPRSRRSGASVTPSSAAASASASPSAIQSVCDDSLIRFSSKTPTSAVSAANRATEMVDEAQGDGILRYSRIPEEVLSPVAKESARGVSAVTPAVGVGATRNLFSNVQYVPAWSSAPRSPHHRNDLHPSTTSIVSTHPRTQQQPSIPDGALEIDVRQGTPPLRRRRAHVH